MIVERWMHTATAGCRQELVELLKGWLEGAGGTGRVCTCEYTDWDKVVLYLEFETEQDQAKFYDNIDWSQPGCVAFRERIHDLRESGSTMVVWHTH